MSQLIQLKQRIKAIGAIKKITQTMRLVSMSSHSKLKKQSEAMQNLKQEIAPLLCALVDQSNEHKVNPHAQHKTLYIAFAAEKGLCGTFNNAMFTHFNKHLSSQALQNSHVISVGKKTTNYLEQKGIKPIASFEKVLPNRLEIIAQELYEKILELHNNYEEVICFYSDPKTFFVQQATQTTIFPIQQDPCELVQKIDINQYEWIQNKKDVTKSLFHILLKVNILLILTNSMLSEQSARFLSMDNATRSADNLLKSMKLAFNKLRQAKITRELIELISSF